MKIRHLISLAMVTLVVGTMALPAGAEEPSIDQRQRYYFECLNAEIDACSCKVLHVNSRSRNLRAYGEEAALRTAFLSKNREALVQEMLAQKVSMRPHAVHQYLRQRFEQASLVQTAKATP